MKEERRLSSTFTKTASYRRMPATPSMPGAGPPSPTGPDMVDDLALGIELKFLMLGLPLSEGIAYRGRLSESEAASKEHQQRQAYAAIASAIERSCGLADDNLGNLSRLAPRAISRYDIADSGSKESEFWRTHWIIKNANSVEYRKGEDPIPDTRLTNGVIVPVEMSSPTLAWTDPFVPIRVKDVVSRVRSSFPVVANYTCDIHVHVGRTDGVAFTLRTLKKLASVFWLAEPLLRSVRDPRSPNYANVYTWGFEQRRYSRLARALDGKPVASDGVRIGEDMLLRIRSGPGPSDSEEEWDQYMRGIRSATRNEALRAIWRAVSPVELGLLLSGTQREHRRLGFNFSAFGEEDERARTNPRTIEFRFLEGTLQDELVLGWLHICGKLVELGMKGRQQHFREVVRYLLTQQNVYEEFWAMDSRIGGGGDHGTKNSEGRFGKHLPPRDILFGELMDHIGADRATCAPFQTKIREEYRSL